jgi:hypothetical protein
MDFVRAFCGLAQQPSAGSAPPGHGDHPMILTPNVGLAGASGAVGPLITPPPSEGGRGSVTGAGGQLVTTTPAGSRRRLLIGLTGGAVGLLAGGAVLFMTLRPPSGTGVGGAEPGAPDLRPAADLRPARPAEPAAAFDMRPAAAVGEGPPRIERPPEGDEPGGKDRRGKERKDRDKDKRRRTPSDADDVDITGIK